MKQFRKGGFVGGGVVLAVIASGVLLTSARQHHAEIRELSQCCVSENDLASLAIDMFIQGLNRKSTFYLRSSTTDSLYAALSEQIQLATGPEQTAPSQRITRDQASSQRPATDIQYHFQVSRWNDDGGNRLVEGVMRRSRGSRVITEKTISMLVRRTPKGWRVATAPWLKTTLEQTYERIRIRKNAR